MFDYLMEEKPLWIGKAKGKIYFSGFKREKIIFILAVQFLTQKGKLVGHKGLVLDSHESREKVKRQRKGN